MTQATMDALTGLRDLSMIKWYVIPLLAIVYYIYTVEIKKARATGNWDAVFAGAAVFGVDFFNETWNGWVMHLSGHSAFWTVPGDTALRTMVGWNIEIMFMFSILGILFYHSLSKNARVKILGIPELWFFAILYTVVCVAIEVVLNIGGHLVWEYWFWNRSLAGIWLILLIGYFHFFCAAIFVITRKSMKAKIITLGIFYAVPVMMNIVAFGFLGWNY
jgi:hypothetical protein